MKEIQLLNKFYQYLREYKDNDSIISILESFCEDYSVLPEEIGMLISEDEYLKDFIKNDCLRRGILKSDNPKKSKIDF